MGPDRGGQHDVVGAGLAELLERARLLGPRHDLDLGADLAGGQGDEDRLGVGGHRRHEHLGAKQAGLAQDVLLGRVTGDVEIVAPLDLGQSLRRPAR